MKSSPSTSCQICSTSGTLVKKRRCRLTGAKVVDFAQYPGAIPGTDSYVALIDALVSRLAAALGGAQ